MTVIHIVFFEFPETASQEEVETHCKAFLALKDTCRKDGHPYILSVQGGKQMSIENRPNWTHGFVAEFASESDRDYYIKEDAVHHVFSANVRKTIVKGQVLDFVPNQF